MEMKQIEITGYEGIQQHVMVEPGKLNVLLGENGSGKSSFLKAVRFGLTGYNSSDYPVNAASSSCTVKILFEDGTEISRSIQTHPDGKQVTKCRMNGKATTAKSIKEYLMMEGYDSDSLKIMTAGELSIAIESNDALAEYILSQLHMQLSFSAISARAKGVSNDALALMERFFPETDFSIDTITKVHDEIKVERTILNRKGKETEARSHFEGIVPVRTLKAVENDINEIMKQESSADALLQTKRSYDQAVQSRQRMMNEIQRLQTLYQQNKAVRPDEEKISKGKEKVKQLQQQLLQINKTMTVFERNVTLMGETLKNLSSDACPLSDQLVCKTDKTQLRQELLDSKAENEDQICLLKEREKCIYAEIEQKEEELSKLQQEKEAYQKKVDLLSKIDLLKKSLPSIPKPVRNPEKPEDLTKKKEILLREKHNILEYQKAQQQQKEADQLKQKAEIYTEAIDFLSPKKQGGIKEQILLTALSTFISHCKTRSKELKLPFNIELYCKKGLEFVCEDQNGHRIPVKNASEGEQIQLVFLILDMINKLSGTGYLVLDNFNHMDAGNSELLLKLLTKKEVLDDYEHIFVAQLPFQENEAALNNIGSASSDVKIISM